MVTINKMVLVFSFEEIDSTQDEARRLIHKGKADFIVIAANQSSGRGTQGRAWVSEKDRGFYVTFVYGLNTNLYASEINLTEYCQRLTSRLVGLLRQELIDYIKDSKLEKLYVKPINDLYYDSKKLAGILTEHLVYKDQSFLVIGIGLNLKKITQTETLMAISLEEICSQIVSFSEENFAKQLYERVALIKA